MLVATLAVATPPDDLDAVSSPREAYERGTQAWKSGDKQAAAYWYARADALEPSDRALGAALRAARAADLPALGMALSERARRSNVSKDVAALAAETRAIHAKRAGRIHVTCRTTEDCKTRVDGGPAPEGGWVEVGRHEVSWTCPTGVKIETVDVETEGEAKLEASCPEWAQTEPEAAPLPPEPVASASGPPLRAAPPSPHSSPAPPPASHGLSPTWFWVGVGVTAVLGAATTWSGLDAQRKHDDFVATGRRDAALRDDGTSAQTRTNLLVVGTGLAALATVSLGLFAVDFGTHAEVAFGATGVAVKARF
jgi:hypothetical protein